jgi:hypothetical protein
MDGLVRTKQSYWLAGSDSGSARSAMSVAAGFSDAMSTTSTAATSAPKRFV